MTRKAQQLGYAMIGIDAHGVREIRYRQWTKHQSFVSGVDFSNSDDGKVPIVISMAEADEVSRRLAARLNDALRTYTGQPIVWVEPMLSASDVRSQDASAANSSSELLARLISHPADTMISSPPQFGQTSLAHYLVKEAWQRHAARWLYFDIAEFKPSNIERELSRALEREALIDGMVSCVIVDGFFQGKDKVRMLTAVHEHFKAVPLIVLESVDDLECLEERQFGRLPRDFAHLHLLALPRGRLRSVVAAYNQQHHIGDDDVVLNKIVSDLDILNIHRTPLNCMTLLKISEKYFDESPVNRTKMLELVLFLLFNTDGVPGYKTRPDLKDCEYVLGRLAENMLRAERYSFTRQAFCKDLRAFCNEKLIDLEVELVFDVLHANNIISTRGAEYGFRYAYWLFYFAAHRMHADQSFASYILDGKRYVNYWDPLESTCRHASLSIL